MLSMFYFFFTPLLSNTRFIVISLPICYQLVLQTANINTNMVELFVLFELLEAGL